MQFTHPALAGWEGQHFAKKHEKRKFGTRYRLSVLEEPLLLGLPCLAASPAAATKTPHKQGMAGAQRPGRSPQVAAPAQAFPSIPVIIPQEPAGLTPWPPPPQWAAHHPRWAAW